MSKTKKKKNKNLPAALGGAPVFVQTAQAKEKEKLDQWRQITEEESQMAYEMTLRNELSGGTPVVREFEKMWRERHQTRFSISVINGTAALHSAMFGLGVGPGDEVICPTYTWICSISPALMLMARPVFCDIDPKTLLIDPEDARRRLTKRTKAIVAVHLWGNVNERVLKDRYKVKGIAIFGSYARDEQNDKSDVDIMVEFEEPVGFEFIHLADFLEELLGVKVDLTTKDSIKPNRWKYIHEDLIYV